MSEPHARPSITRALVSGARLGKFELREVLGRGGFGEVWRARDTIDGVDRALKVMLPSAFEQPGLVERFLRESRTASRLSHPNVVRTFEPNQTDDGFVYLPMELMNGLSLGEYVKGRREPVPVEVAVRLMAAVCRGVAYVHEKGLVHRDLKPANVFLHRDPDDRELVIPKVIDFGAVKVLEIEEERSSTQAPSPMTLRYAAPEQVMGRKHEIDARTDVFALGVMLYELLTRQRPHTASSYVEHFARAAQDVAVKPLREHVAGVPEALDALVLRCLSRERAGRPDNAGALLAELVAAAQSDVATEALTALDVFPPELPKTEEATAGYERKRDWAKTEVPAESTKSRTVPPPPSIVVQPAQRGSTLALLGFSAGLSLAAVGVLWRTTHEPRAAGGSVERGAGAPVASVQPAARREVEVEPRAVATAAALAVQAAAPAATASVVARARPSAVVRPAVARAPSAVASAPVVVRAPSAAASAPSITSAPSAPSITSAPSAAPVAPTPSCRMLPTGDCI